MSQEEAKTTGKISLFVTERWNRVRRRKAEAAAAIALFTATVGGFNTVASIATVYMCSTATIVAGLIWLIGSFWARIFGIRWPPGAPYKIRRLGYAAYTPLVIIPGYLWLAFALKPHLLPQPNPPVKGTLCFSGSGAPVPDALVRVDQTGQSTSTDDAGRFVIPNVSVSQPKVVAFYHEERRVLLPEPGGIYHVFAAPVPQPSVLPFHVIRPAEWNRQIFSPQVTSASGGTASGSTETFSFKRRVSVPPNFCAFHFRVRSNRRVMVVTASLISPLPNMKKVITQTDESSGSDDAPGDSAEQVDADNFFREWRYEPDGRKERELEVEVLVCLRTAGKEAAPTATDIEGSYWFEVTGGPAGL